MSTCTIEDTGKSVAEANLTPTSLAVSLAGEAARSRGLDPSEDLETALVSDSAPLEAWLDRENPVGW